MNDIEVLLVEDNADEAKLTMRALSKNNITNNIIWLKDGEEAENFIFAKGQYSERNIQNKPKVILLDLKLPKVTGLEFLKLIKANEDTRSIPVVVLTASREDKDLKECYNLGVNSYIVKPVNFEQFFKSAKEIGLYWVLINQPPD